MGIFKRFLDFYLEGSIHVALAAYALIRITLINFGLEYNEEVCYFAFYGTILGYNFIKYHELVSKKQQNISSYHYGIVLISIVSLIMTGYYYYQLQLQTQIVTFFLLLLTIFYTLPFSPQKANARNWSGLKIYLVCLCWVGVTVLLPIFNSEIEFDFRIIIYLIQTVYFGFCFDAHF